MRQDLEHPKHPKGYLSDMLLLIKGKIWKIRSIVTGAEIYHYPFGYEYLGYKYDCKFENKEMLIDEDEITPEMFITKEESPEYFI